MAMTKKIKLKIDDIADLIEHEVHDCKKLSGNKLAHYRETLQIEEIHGDIFFSKSDIVYTDPDDFEVIEYMVEDDAKVIKIELAELGTYLYVVRHFNCQILKEALKLWDL
jgi:hypothetical protein